MALIWNGDVAAVEIERRVKVLVDNIADQLLENAVDEVPVDTGDLQASGIVIETGPTTSIVAFPLYYAHFVEYGTVQHEPNPFLRRAITATIPYAQQITQAR